MKTKYEDIVTVARYLGSNPDYVQGGGGNVSIKINDTLMAVKASGFCLDEITVDKGLVKVNHAKLREHYKTPPVTSDLLSLIASNDIVVNECIECESHERPFRPSLETGFHAILGNVVIHTHSVYANLLTCTEEGEDLIYRLHPEAVLVPYKTPGVALTHAIQSSIEEHPRNIIYLENHGIIAVDDDHRSASALHEKINNDIKSYFKITEPYPSICIRPLGDNRYISEVSYLTNFIKRKPELISNFANTILFPDQVVYGDQISFDCKKPEAITIDLETGDVILSGSANFVRAAVETLVAWVYLVETTSSLDLTIKTIPITEGDFIANLDSEKYRKAIL